MGCSFQWNSLINDIYNNQILIMQLTQLFANAISNPKELKIQSKQQFFNTKHQQKRMKKSTCFSQQIEKEKGPIEELDCSFKSEQPFSKCNKELESTFGQENVLAFQPKPLKRKRNLRQHNYLPKIGQNQASSDSDSSTTNSHIFTRKNSEVFKSVIQLFHKASNTPASSLRIQNFEILAKIGEGSYSEVFKAVQKSTGFLCALKVLQKWKMKQMNVRENVIREIKINMFLNHPNIAKLYGCFDDQHFIYLVCEYATDGNLYDTIKQPKYPPKKESADSAISLVSQICEGIRFIHTNFIIHRDIKPENILLTLNHTVKICDFGWSIYNPSKQLRLTLCGTPLYLAPEMISQNYYDEAIDIWAIGVMTYQLLAEQSPFKITQMRDISKIITDEINFSLIANKEAVDFIRKTMEKDARKRKSIVQLCHHPFIANLPESNSHL